MKYLSSHQPDEAERFIRELYTYVLSRDSFGEEELRSWTNFLIKTGNPIETFRRFAKSAENQRRLEAAADTSTMYPSGHFYSPVVARSEILKDQDRIFGKKGLLGIDLNEAAQAEVFLSLSPYLASLPFPETASPPLRYYYNNTSYGFGDAAIYWGMLSMLTPRRIIEIGSGFTSVLALDTIDLRKLNTKCTFIDPFPHLLKRIAGDLIAGHELIAKPVYDVDVDIVESLEENDVLFIDSSHVVKTGSDTHFEITEMLPRLRSGVIVHFHDIFFPFEYPRPWIVNDNKSWNELYMIHAFLMYNKEFEIMYFNDYFAKNCSSFVIATVPTVASRLLLNPGGGLWLRRT